MNFTPTRSVAAAALALACLASFPASAYLVEHDFDAPWAGDYAPGWENTLYRHGPPPVGKMMEHVGGGVGGGGAMRLIADSTPQSWMWWAGVNPTGVDHALMTRQYDPWVSVDLYDDGYAIGEALQAVGQLYAVPNWVNPYLPGGEDWTDVQFGARFNQPPPNDNYYYVAAGETNPGWQDTGISRADGDWVNLMMQLSSSDGMIHFFINGIEVGASHRNDYDDLVGMGLYTQFTPTLSDWGTDKPSAIFDNFRFGSSAVPAPGTLALLGAGTMLIAFGARRRVRS